MDNRFYRVQANINLDAIRQNIISGKSLVPSETKFCVVVKANAYGHGAVQVVKNIDDLADAYAVATVEEGVELRRSGATQKPILILGYVFPENAEEAIRNDIELTVFDSVTAKRYDIIAQKIGKKAILHIALDTGMSRIGYLCTEKSDIIDSVSDIRKIVNLQNIEIKGMFTHFCKADEADKTYAKEQLGRYLDFSEKLYECGIEIPLKHVCNSAGIIDVPEGHLDMVRFGVTTYGYYPTDDVTKEKCPVTPAMELKTHVSMVKTIPAGTGIGYSQTHICSRQTVLATIPVGYGDGLPRGLSNSGRVLIHGKSAKILGRICMDQCMVDVTDIPDVAVGDTVTLMGRDGEEYISAVEIGETVGNSFHYEVICDIAKRVPRVYFREGKICEQ